MSAPPSSLPTPRQLLTSILNAISKIPPTPPTPDTSTRPDALGGRANPPKASSSSSSNPLKRLDPSHRPLFTTLHVLFPSLLLPALDLLDRGLVTRLVQPYSQLHEDGDVAMGEDGRVAQPGSIDPASSAVYVVRSAQKPTGRRPYADAAAAATATASTMTTASTVGQTIYVAHTSPWNCTCAAFAFAAFPPAAVAAVSTRTNVGEEIHEDKDGDDAWGFGGMSFDGTVEGDGAVPPCCKHLLACVLAERWAVLGGYVNERRVGREELAGIFADV